MHRAFAHLQLAEHRPRVRLLCLLHRCSVFGQPSLFSRSWNALETCFAFFTLNVPLSLYSRASAVQQSMNFSVFIQNWCSFCCAALCSASCCSAFVGIPAAGRGCW